MDVYMRKVYGDERVVLEYKDELVVAFKAKQMDLLQANMQLSEKRCNELMTSEYEAIQRKL